jgi:hypothetical protein
MTNEELNSLKHEITPEYVYGYGWQAMVDHNERAEFRRPIMDELIISTTGSRKLAGPFELNHLYLVIVEEKVSKVVFTEIGKRRPRIGDWYWCETGMMKAFDNFSIGPERIVYSKHEEIETRKPKL